jgi:hypothetical protein
MNQKMKRSCFALCICFENAFPMYSVGTFSIFAQIFLGIYCIERRILKYIYKIQKGKEEGIPWNVYDRFQRSLGSMVVEF